MTRGVQSSKKSPWFAVRLNRRSAPWAFEKGEAFRVIAALELLGALVGLMVLMPVDSTPTPEFGASVTISCGTDNQGNSFLLDKMMTTAFPLGVVLMELSHQMRRRRAILSAEWIPRDQNEEADRLTNGLFHDFDPALRIPVDLGKLDFGIMPDLFEQGKSYIRELEEKRRIQKELRQAGLSEEGAGRRPGRLGGKAGRLRDRDPWL